MAIILPDPGDTIAHADIESGWTSTRNIVNAQSGRYIRRDALSQWHLPRLLATPTGDNRGRDYVSSSTPVTITQEFTSTSSLDIRSHWYNLLSLDGAPGTAGYAHEGCWGIVVASVEIGEATVDINAGMLMAVTVEIDGGLAHKFHESDWRYSLSENYSPVAPNWHDSTMHMMTVLDLPVAGTITRVKLWAAIDDNDGDTKSWVADSCSLSLYLFHQG